MAKITKSAAVETAKIMARTHEGLNAMTVEQINAFPSYGERRNLARELYAAGGFATHFNTQYLTDTEQAFIDEAMHIWTYKVKALETARRNWKRATEGLSMEQAIIKVRDLVTSMNIRGARIDGHRVAIARFSNYEDATLYWSFERNWDEKGTRNPDDESQRAGTYTLELKISVSGTSYSPAKMAVLNKVHTELVDAANEIEAVMEQERIIWTQGIPEPTPVVEVEPAAVAGGPDDDRLN